MNFKKYDCLVSPRISVKLRHSMKRLGDSERSKVSSSECGVPLLNEVKREGKGIEDLITERCDTGRESMNKLKSPRIRSLL